MQRTTILDIAREAGVSKSTVSRALTNHPRISDSTKERILKISERLGYRPDPAMRILCSYRDAKRQQESIREFPIAIVTDFAEPPKGIYVPNLIQDIKENAVGIGYIISVIDASEYPRPEAVANVLKSRGVRGIIMMAISRKDFAEQFPWGDFCVVLHGQPQFRPPCHMVREDRFDRMVKAIRRSWELGYRHPAFVMVSQSQESRYFNLMSGAYFSEIARLTGAPSLIPPRQISPDETAKDIRDWFDTEKPDVIIAENEGVYIRLQNAGLQIPRDLGYISIFRHPDHPEIAGFGMETKGIAVTMVHQLDLLIRHDIKGDIDPINTILVKKEMSESKSLPPATESVGKRLEMG